MRAEETVAARQRDTIEGAFDLVIVGAGLSSSYTTIRLLEKLRDQPTAPRPLRVLLIEKSGDFFGGIAYGRQSGTSALIITPLDEFLPSDELADFQTWMAANADELLADVAAAGGVRTTEWLQRVGPALRNGACSRFHVPRGFWGRYVAERVLTLAEACEAAGQVELTLLAAEVTDVAKTDSGFAITAGEQTIDARLTVLALGMPPTKSLFSAVGDTPGALLIDRPYGPDLDTTVEQIATYLADTTGTHLAIVGANAGSLEMLYMLANHPTIAAAAPQIHLLSPQGRLPERFRATPDPAFRPDHLTELADAHQVTADDILKAVELDLVDARSNGFGISDSLPTISSGVGALLAKLDAAELQSFVSHAGIEIGRLQRRAGDEYCDAADDLLAAGRLHIQAGLFDRVSTATEGNVATVWYRGTDDDLATLPHPLAVVVNCAGSGGLARPNQSALIESLLTRGLTHPTESGQGLAVDDRFQASPGLFVNGPLLAGNVVNGGGIWHVEHCGRIINFSGILADHLWDALHQ